MSHDSREVKSSPEQDTPVSRRTIVGLMVAAVGSLLSACRQGIGAGATPVAEAVEPKVVSTESSEASATMVRPTSTATKVPTMSTQTSTATPSPAFGSSQSPPPPPTSTPLPPTFTPVPATPTKPPLPTAAPAAVPNRGALMAHWPSSETSRVVWVRNDRVWAGDVPDPTVVLQMLDDGLRTLANVSDVMVVWRTLFDASERVLLKVNCIAYGGPTQPAVTYAVAQRLQEAGLRAENILIFDRTDHELGAAGYNLNDGGAGVQCHGSRGEGTEAALSQARVRFYQELDACDAIVNLPIPKQHTGAGVSVALKNHYGSINNPGALHGNWCDPAIAELNAQPTVRDKTRLVVAAALNVSPRDWNRPKRDNALLLSFDPVALDTVARDILVGHRQALGLDSGYLVEGSRHLRTAHTLGLGATDGQFIDLREVSLG